jgi:hypothetical protein
VKKLIIVSLFVLAFGARALGQEQPEAPEPPVIQELPKAAEVPVEQSFPRNEIDLSLSLGTVLQYGGTAGGMLVSLLGSLIGGNIYLFIPIIIPGPSIEYDRWINDRISVGALASADIVSALPTVVVGRTSIAPVVKYCWLDNGSLRMYSKLAAGYHNTFAATFRNGKFESLFDNMDFFNEYADMLGKSNTTNPSVLFLKYVGLSPFAWQVSPLGVDVHTALKNCNFFAELGIGTLGFVSFGLKYAF